MPKYSDSGVLFIRTKNKPTQPDFTGRAEIECPHCHVETQWEVASWMKQGQKEKFFSLKFQQKEKREEQQKEETKEGGFPWER